MTGTSTGALIAPFATLVAEDRDYLPVLNTLYLDARKREIVRLRIGRLFGILWGDLPRGLYSLKPLRRKIYKELVNPMPRGKEPPWQVLKKSEIATIVTAVDLLRGELLLATQDDFVEQLEYFYRRSEKSYLPLATVWPFENDEEKLFATAMEASSAIPVGITPVGHTERTKEWLFVDGGVYEFAPLAPADALCCTDALVVSTAPERPVPQKAPSNLIGVGMRSLNLLMTEALRNDIQRKYWCWDFLARLEQLENERDGLLRELGTSSPNGQEQRRTQIESLDKLLSVLYLALEDTGCGPGLKSYPIFPTEPLGKTMDFSRKEMKRRFDHGVDRVSYLWETDERFRELLKSFSESGNCKRD